MSEIWVDGGIKNASYFGQYGTGYAKVNFSPTQRVELSLSSDNNTNNEAEFFAVLFGITEALKNKLITKNNKLIIYSDSQFVVNSIVNNWKTKEDRLKLILSALKSLVKQYDIQLIWKPRENNLAT